MGQFDGMERVMNLTALLARLETVEELDAAREALVTRYTVVAAEAAAKVLPTFKVGDTVLFKSPNPKVDIPIAGKVVRVGKKLNLDLQIEGGVVRIPAFRCTRVNHEA